MRIGVGGRLSSGILLGILLAGRSAQAQDHAKTVSADFLNRDVQARFDSAKVLRQAGKFEEALGKLTLMGANPGALDDRASIFLWREIADIQRVTFHPDAALQAIEKGLLRAMRLKDGGLGSARLLLAKGEILLDQGRLAEARDCYQLVIDIERDLGDSTVYAMAALGISDVLQQSGEFAGARETVTRAMTRVEAATDLETRLSLIIRLGEIHAEQREYVQARKVLEESSRLLLSAKNLDPQRRAPMLAKLAFVYFQIGLRGWASRFILDASAAALLTREPLQIELASNCMAIIGPDGESHQENSAFQAEHIRTHAGYFRKFARQAQRAGETYLKLGRFADALRSLQYARLLSKTLSDKDDEAMALAGLSRAYLRLGQSESAAVLLDQAAALLSERSEPALQIDILSSCGRTHLGLASKPGAHAEKARQSFERISAIAAAPQDLGGKVEALAALALIAELRNVAKPVGPGLESIRELARKSGPDAEARVLSLLGSVYARAGDAASAERTLIEGIEIARTSGSHSAESALLQDLGALLEKRGTPKEALTAYLGAINALEDDGQEEYVGSRVGLGGSDDPYQAAAGLLMRANRSREAFGVMERARSAHSLGAVARNLSEADTSTMEDRDLLQLERYELWRKLAAERARTTPNPALLRELERTMAAANERYREIASQIATGPPGSRRPVGTNTGLSTDEVQAKLPDDTALLSYFTSGNALYGFAVRRNLFIGFEVPLTNVDLAHLIDQGASSSVVTSRDALSRLYKALIGPARKIADAPVIAVEPAGPLHDLPFNALVDGEHYLIDDHTLFSVPSAGVLLSPSRVEKTGQGLLVAEVDGSSEGSDVYETWYGTGAGMLRATPATFQLRARRSGIIHFASRVSLDPQGSLLPPTLLNSNHTARHDIDLFEVLESDLHAVGLVVLTAPEGPSEPNNRGDDIRILNRAFLEAGVSTVVAATRQMPDAARRALLRSFYQQLRARQGRAEALRLAQLQIRQQYPGPDVWAAFTLTGDPSALDEFVIAPSGLRIAGAIAAVDWPYFVLDTKDHSRIRIRFQPRTSLERGDEDLPPSALKPGILVRVDVSADSDSVFNANAVEVLSSATWKGGAQATSASTIETADDPVLRAATAAADSSTETLPNFTCRQYTLRAVSIDDGLTWTHTDKISADVIYSDKAEVYKNIQQGKTVWRHGIMDLDGLSSSGEYGTVLRNLFLTSVSARFRYRNAEVLNDRPVFVYDYWVGEATGDWQLTANRKVLNPAYHGTVWIDRINLSIWKIRKTADIELPSDFPWRRAQSEILFDLGKMNDGNNYILPQTATMLVCERGKTDCSRNEMEFREYKRYQANSEIRFDSPGQVPRTETASVGGQTWTGILEPFKLLDIRNGQSSPAGSLVGGWFPIGSVVVSVTPGVEILDAPGAQNNWSRILLKNGSKTIKKIEIHWEREAK